MTDSQRFPENLRLHCEDPSREAEAFGFSQKWNIPLSAEAEGQPALVFSESGLSLRKDGLVLRGDFAELLPRLRENNLRQELLCHAAKLKDCARPVRVVDATAGMGEDSLLLAASGCEVLLCEYDPVIAALLRDTLQRAALHPGLRDIVSRMTLAEEDSTVLLRELPEQPDVVYLDPMFPERRKSGLIGKKFQLLQLLERPCTEESELFEAALAAKPFKIIVKRPSKGPLLAGKKPSYVLAGKAVRYDCYVFPSNRKTD